MSQYRTYFDIMEEQVDDNDDIIKDFKTNLPHHDFICQAMCKSWNNMHIEQFFDGPLAKKIKSAKMTYSRGPHGESFGHITFVGTPGFRFTQRMKEELDDQVSAQFSDGWGESFFGYINIMTAPDGTRFMVE